MVSAEAAKSQWVRAEADAARGLGTLVQATRRRNDSADAVQPDPVRRPSRLGRRPIIAGWRKLEASVAALAGRKRPASESRRTSSARGLICVLPFANMSGDAEQEYFSDGISEDITTDLSKVSALGVTARNTAFTFKGQAVDVCDVARKLGVSHVLEGSVRKAGNASGSPPS